MAVMFEGTLGYTQLGIVASEFRSLGYNCDRIPRVMHSMKVGVDVHFSKGAKCRITCPKDGGDVTIEVVVGKQVVKDGKLVTDRSATAVVGLAQELLLEASIG